MNLEGTTQPFTVNGRAWRERGGKEEADMSLCFSDHVLCDPDHVCVSYTQPGGVGTHENTNMCKAKFQVNSITVLRGETE